MTTPDPFQAAENLARAGRAMGTQVGLVVEQFQGFSRAVAQAFGQVSAFHEALLAIQLPRWWWTFPLITLLSIAALFLGAVLHA